MVLGLLADAALSESTPIYVTLGAVITLVSIAFGGGLVWSKLGHRLLTLDGPEGKLAQLRAELHELKRERARDARDVSDGEAQLAARIHQQRDVLQDLLVRIAQVETHIGYDGRGQSTPVRSEPAPLRGRRPQTPDPGESR